MESLGSLKSMDEKLRRLSATHDMTQSKEDCKQLVMQAKDK